MDRLWTPGQTPFISTRIRAQSRRVHLTGAPSTLLSLEAGCQAARMLPRLETHPPSAAAHYRETSSVRRKHQRARIRDRSFQRWRQVARPDRSHPRRLGGPDAFLWQDARRSRTASEPVAVDRSRAADFSSVAHRCDIAYSGAMRPDPDAVDRGILGVADSDRVAYYRGVLKRHIEAPRREAGTASAAVPVTGPGGYSCVRLDSRARHR